MKCAISGCLNKKGDNSEKYYFYAPRSVSARELWIKATGKSFKLNTAFVICEDHFDMRNDVEYYRLNGTPFLKRSVYPHRNLEESEIKLQTKINKINWSCCVPNCENRRLMQGKKVIFFPVPDGKLGVLWEAAIAMQQRNVNWSSLQKNKFCCEEHFDINKDINKIFHYNGSLEFKVKDGICPSLKLNNATGISIDSTTSNETKKSYLVDSIVHSRLAVNTHISYFYDLNDIKFEADDEFDNVTEIKIETFLETERVVKTEPIDFGYEAEYDSEFVIKTELEADVLDCAPKSEPESISESEPESESESEPSLRNKDDDPDVTTDDFSTESDDTVSSSDLDVSKESDTEESNDELIERFECQYCKQLVRRLDDHVERVHLNPAKNLNQTICGLCGEKFEYRGHLKRHQNKVHNGNRYACALCDFMTPVYFRISRHIINMHSNEKHCLCHICGKDYKFPKDLKRHVNSKHMVGIRERKHACHMCDKKYFDAHTLTSHISSIHLNERPFRCEVDGCGKAFKKKTVLTTHQQIHMKRKLFACIICEKKFTFQWNLRTHIKNIHGT